VDKAAREVIENAGYGKYFTHRTGHGIGMEAHEDPYIRGDNLQLLEPGMTFTVEPGIYLMGRNGVRIEDNVAITAKGAEVLSDLPREMQVSRAKFRIMAGVNPNQSIAVGILVPSLVYVAQPRRYA
jgi:Xaa-Pro dipeptidase